MTPGRPVKYKVQLTENFVILGHFLPFQPTDNPENQNFKIEKKAPRDIINLHICNINEKHNTEFFAILGRFLPFHGPRK